MLPSNNTSKGYCFMATFNNRVTIDSIRQINFA